MNKASYILFISFALSLSLFSCKGSKSSNKKSNSTVNTNYKHKGSKSSSNSSADKAVKSARSYIGTKYKYGGMSKKGIDCSGLMCLSYKEAGKTLPRTSGEQSKAGKRIYIGELKKGDLVFFGAKPNSKKITHVGMVSSVSKTSVKFIHASSSRGVVESELLSSYYKPRYVKAIRP